MKNQYLPYTATIKSVKVESHDTTRFTLDIQDGEKGFQYKPGQFVELSILGYGESPISISSNPDGSNQIELCVRRVGKVTGALHKLGVQNTVGIRGPYGNNFPVADMKGKDLVFVAGGLGLAPLRSLIKTVFADRSNFGKVTILYGARTAKDLLFRDELVLWQKLPDTEVLITVDVGSPDWRGNVGVVTTLFNMTSFTPAKSMAIVCGPPIMFRFVVQELLKRGFTEDSIVLTVERMMKCGLGKCGHCNIGSKYACLDGPVFKFNELKVLPEALS